MLNLRPFQIVLYGIFAAFAVGGIIMFASFRGFLTEENPYGNSVEIWGTLAQAPFHAVLLDFKASDERIGVISYRQMDERTFVSELTNAIAEGRGPDAIVLSNDFLLPERKKIFPFSYESFPKRDFKDRYIDGAEIFQLNDGTYGFPLAVDPLILYWNRDMFSSAGLAVPPATWEALVSTVVPAITVRSDPNDIVKSAVAFGEFQNIEHATEILLALMLQAGSRLVQETSSGFQAVLNDSTVESSRPPAEAAVGFYTRFANPVDQVYSWNRSLKKDRQAFLSGDLALYFGFGSESESLANGNPNLNFDSAQMPQGATAPTKRTYGTFYSLALLKSSDNIVGAQNALALLASEKSSEWIANGLGLAPVYRNSIARGNADSFFEVIYKSALIARAWFDPMKSESRNIFGIMISDITAGRARVGEAVGDAVKRLSQLVK